MEELADFFWEILQDDLAREARAKAEAEGEAEGMNKIIRYFISTHPAYSIQEVAAQLGVEEQLVRSVFPAKA